MGGCVVNVGVFARTRNLKLARGVFAVVLAIWFWGCGAFAQTNLPPPIMREFRGAWIATVGNINWPSKPGLPTEQQQAELRAILDNAADLKLNAIIFQVRPACDAFYKSDLEPWSDYLTGELGKAPSPYYDPLEFAVAEAHARGLELHAWFNPYRAGVLPRKGPVPAKHVSKSRPQLVKKYGTHEWLDPGEDAVKEHTTRVILDVVRRYDIDGVHLDDYFYPYKEKDGRGAVIDFPDENSWKAYRKRGGKLERNDWRRQNVNDLMQRLYTGIHRTKPWVRFGISPFGIWRPGFPPQVDGLDAYEALYADSRRWLREGWVDYLAPQLYWKISAPKQSYPELLKWWLGENPRHRYVWPGSNLSWVRTNGWEASEIVRQFTLERELNPNPGHLIWNFNRVLANESGVRSALAQGVYGTAAIPPAFSWLDGKAPGRPEVVIKPESGLKTTVQWKGTGTEKAWLWALQTRIGGNWTTEIIPGQFNARTFTRDKTPEVVAVTAIDRCANASLPTLLTVGQAPTGRASLQ
jgi:uncharacterized lipoprotein YddW (UPF0748 family)